MMQPVIRWAGGKRRLLTQIREHYPQDFNDYIEGFCGGCAVGLDIMNNITENLENRNYYFFDINSELINFYNQIQDENLDQRIKTFIEANATESQYYIVRGMDRLSEYPDMANHVKALRFYYLNQFCFNGLYRINSKGYHNVPLDKARLIDCNIEQKKKSLLDFKNFLSKYRISFNEGDFFERYHAFGVDPNDFVYLDPPYHNTFTGYSTNGFTYNDFAALMQICDDMNRKGAKVMVSYNDFPSMIELKPKGFKIHHLGTYRSIGANVESRGKTEEMIMINY